MNFTQAKNYEILEDIIKKWCRNRRDFGIVHNAVFHIQCDNFYGNNHCYFLLQVSPDLKNSNIFGKTLHLFLHG